jgi:hypothetical protein
MLPVKLQVPDCACARPGSAPSRSSRRTLPSNHPRGPGVYVLCGAPGASRAPGAPNAQPRNLPLEEDDPRLRLCEYAAHFSAVRPEPIHLPDGFRRHVSPLRSERSLDSFVRVFPLRHDWSPPEGLCVLLCSVPRPPY